MATNKHIWQLDFDVLTPEMERQRHYYVVEANDLIGKARHDLSSRELKIMDFVISKIQPSDQSFDTIHTSLGELSNLLNINNSGKNYSDLAKNIGDLRKKEVLIYNKDRETVIQTGWLQSAEYHKDGQVEIELSEKLAPYLLGLKSNYTQYLLMDTVKLSSKYSILLYKLMRERDKDKGASIAILQGTPDEFKEWLGAPSSYEYKKLKQSILNKAIAEINEHIPDMDLELFQGRRGRKVVQVEIHNNWTVHNNQTSNIVSN